MAGRRVECVFDRPAHSRKLANVYSRQCVYVRNSKIDVRHVSYTALFRAKGSMSTSNRGTIAHVESGVRSRKPNINPPIPEKRSIRFNRIVVDAENCLASIIVRIVLHFGAA